jgi:mannosylglycoprotein endo-beta-mannosidase
MLVQIQELDREDDSSGLDEEGCAFHYHLEDQLMQILSSEEYWWQRGRQNWILFGDANTAYFHAIANGRRCKSVIHSLQSDHGLISNPQEIMQHICELYIGLMGTDEPKFMSLSASCWTEYARTSVKENDQLAITFLVEDLEEIVKSMKTATAPGLYGFPMSFFKNCWHLVKDMLLQILNGFVLGMVDISRLNFGIISLIPKVSVADMIKPYRPIALINVIFKFVAKGFASILSPVAHQNISPT